MKLQFSVINNTSGIHYTKEINLPAYIGTYDVIDMFKSVIEFHEAKYKNYKQKYIEAWGQEQWDILTKFEEQHEKK